MASCFMMSMRVCVCGGGCALLFMFTTLAQLLGDVVVYDSRGFACFFLKGENMGTKYGLLSKNSMRYHLEERGGEGPSLGC